MKKIFMTLTAVGTLSTAILLTACNNAEETKKIQDEEAAKIQSMVDTKMMEMQTMADAECAARVDSAAQLAYTAWVEENAKPAKGGKPKPKPAAKKEEKKEEKGLGAGKVGKESEKPKLGEGKVGKEEEKPKLGKGKLGTQNPPK